MLKKLLVFSTLYVLGAVILAACGGTAGSVPGGDPPAVDAPEVDPVAITREYFSLINQAETQVDLGLPWDMLTNQAQCSAIGMCELSYFQEYWWPYQVEYEIYACSEQTTNAVLTIHARGQAPSDQDEVRIYRVELLPVEDTLWIDRMRVIPQVDEGCVLAP